MYATLGQLKGMLGITATTDDINLLRLLDVASRMIDKHTNRFFYCLEGQRYYDGAAQTLMLPDDILSITSLYTDPSGAGIYTTLIPPTSYLCYPLNKFPTTWLKSTNISAINFASNIRAGVKITGVFGHGDGKTAKPYIDSGDNVQTDPLTSSGTSVAVTTGGNFSPGMVLRIENEQVYVSAVSTNTLTIQRAQNGTIASPHIKGTAIYIYQYPSEITQWCIDFATAEWNLRKARGYSGERIADYSYTMAKPDYTDIEIYVRKLL